MRGPGKVGQQLAEASVEPITAKVWRVEVGGEAYSLKRWADHALCGPEYKLLVWLKERGLPVFPPILSEDNAPWVHSGAIFMSSIPLLKERRGKFCAPPN